MNTNTNTYTVIYTTVLVVVVAAILAFAATALKSRQQANADLAKMKTIMLAANFGEMEDGSVDKTADFKQIYESHVTRTFVVNEKGEIVEGVDAFKDIDLKSEFNKLKSGASAKLPVYECTMDDGRTIHILAMYGAGLWGAIWGYVAVESDNETVAGAIFDHASETPGLGAKIAEPAFYTQFRGKRISDAGGQFSSVKVIKGGANGDANGVDAISGATITSNAVGKSLAQWLEAYKAFLTSGASAAKKPACCAAEGESCCGEGGCASQDSTLCQKDVQSVNSEKDE